MTTKLTPFDIKKFNADFDQEKADIKENVGKLEQARLAELNKEPPKKQIYEYSVAEIIIGIKDAWFDILDDLLQHRLSAETFLRDNRMFFVGLTVVIIVIILYLYDIITEEEEIKPIPQIKEIHYIHHSASAPPDKYMTHAENVVVLSAPTIEEDL